jgi:hypothetical protein
MRFAAVHPLIGTAEGTGMAFNVLHQAECHTGLAAARSPANRAELANFGQSAIQFGLSVHDNRDQTRVHRKRGPASVRATHRP